MTYSKKYASILATKGGISVNILEGYKNKKLEKVLEKAEDSITGLVDLIGDKNPSMLFYLLADKLIYLLDNDPKKCFSKEGIELRKKLNHLIKLVGPAFLKDKQIIENRNSLIDSKDNTPDSGIIVPDEPVIWTANHAFKDDTLATILAIKRNAYILFGSLPQFYNTIDGVLAWLNGSVVTNRKVSTSKHASIDKSNYIMDNGADLMMFIEGVWNKTPNKLMLKVWPGVYRLCAEKGYKVIPVAHYVRDCTNREKNNPIHTVVDDPIRIDDLSEKAALEYLRDIICTWYYLMMEKYGQSTREEELKGFSSSKEAWENELVARVATADRYDPEIEYIADYRPKDECVDDIWTPIANVKNITKDNILLVEDAKQKIIQFKENDFQRRY